MPRDPTFPRGSSGPRSLISPATAAMRSKPWRAMKVNPISEQPRSAAPRRRTDEAGVAISTLSIPVIAHKPPAMTERKPATLVTLIHWPPPPLRRSRPSVRRSSQPARPILDMIHSGDAAPHPTSTPWTANWANEEQARRTTAAQPTPNATRTLSTFSQRYQVPPDSGNAADISAEPARRSKPRDPR